MKINLTTRFVIILLVVGLLPVGVLSLLVSQSTEHQKEGSADQLHQIAVRTSDTIERNLFERYGDVQAFTANEAVLTHKLGSPESTQLLTAAINRYVKLYGCYPLSMVVDAQGRCVAVNTRDATGKPVDSASLLGKDYSGASWFRNARDGRFLKSESLDGTVVEDVARDADAANLLGNTSLTVSFSAPIFDRSGAVIGVWRNLADFALVEEVLKSTFHALEHSGLPSAEVALIRKDGVLLAEYDPADAGTKDFQRSADKVLKLNLVDLGVESARLAAAGGSGEGEDFHARKKRSVASGYHHSKGALGYPGLGWSVLVRAPMDELHEAANTTLRLTWITVGVSVVLLIVVAWLVARSITKPILASVEAMKRLAEGDLTGEVDASRHDELGTLAQAINTSMSRLRDLLRQLQGSSEALAKSSHSLNETSQSQAAVAEQTTAQANTVASAGEELSVSTRSMSETSTRINQATTGVASSMEEMSASIQEVANNSTKGAEISHRADQQARATKELMAQLDDSARQISKIVDIINHIAEQTNLLALNASIEAASAGEAGRGFAVVANEVKELARQSASASEEIRKQIDSIQKNAGAAVGAIDEVTRVIQQVSQMTSSIAAAVEEQSATVSEVTRSLQDVSSSTTTLSENIRQAAAGAEDVSRNIRGVSEASQVTAQGASNTSAASTELNELAAQLRQHISAFKL
ncbi:MAG: methyl-accepting chemotaxis protein [Opitutaceae bacterium]|nr:methyl-accepting chemotaxis protein [Opitutaceae bacterium]